MPPPALPLPENAGLAFTGEAEWPPACITAAQAISLAAARNPTGRPNSDVLRSFVGKTGQRLREHWQIDFPAHYREQEAALHEKPFALLQNGVAHRTAPHVGPAVGASLLATHHPRNREQARFHNHKSLATASSASWWINPHAQPPLRLALARLDRFLATALDSREPTWSWFESEDLPDASLLVVARDDDFTHAVLQSTAFASWWHAHFRHSSSAQIIESFPFPWPPATPLGSLTKAQQELRSAVARAALTGDIEQINTGVAAAYGWPNYWDESEILAALNDLHRVRLVR